MKLEELYRVEYKWFKDGNTVKVWFEDCHTAFGYFDTKAFYKITDCPPVCSPIEVKLFKGNQLYCFSGSREPINDWYYRYLKVYTGIPKEDYQDIKDHLWCNWINAKLSHLDKKNGKEHPAKFWHNELIQAGIV